MAPPGFAPPGYSHDQIPTRFVNRELPPEGTDTNGRAYFIFFSYLGLCISLTAFIIYKLVKSYDVLSNSKSARRPEKKHMQLFAGLAAGSLLTTWFFMFRYFQVSYKTWVMWRSYYELTPDKMHWGLWLKETSLFREAWETAVVGNARYWWTHQIFFFACGLGLSLEQYGFRRGIKHTWAFMLLGQIVAISFATNLFILSLLLSPPPPLPQSSTGIYRRKWLGPWLVNLFTIILVEGPAYMLADEHYWHHQTDFMPMLLTPHVALMVLPILRAIVPEKYFNDSGVEFAGKIYKYLWSATLLGGSLLLIRVTGLAYGYSGIQGIWHQLLEHPAVSSVSFDVIFCWISWIMWWTVQQKAVGDTFKIKKDEDEDEWVGAGSGRVAPVMGSDSGMRRRQ